jgi:hypothetical protein
MPETVVVGDTKRRCKADQVETSTALPGRQRAAAGHPALVDDPHTGNGREKIDAAQFSVIELIRG